jgi:mono/diheme cytochrome c family protein
MEGRAMQWGTLRLSVLAVLALALAGAIACSSSSGTESEDDADPTATATNSPSPTAGAASPTASASPAATRTATAEAGMEDGDPENLVEIGREIYFRPGLCVTCHGQNAEGVVGPPIVGKTRELIELMLDTNDAMLDISLTDKQLDALEAYLMSLVP